MSVRIGGRGEMAPLIKRALDEYGSMDNVFTPSITYCMESVNALSVDSTTDFLLCDNDGFAVCTKVRPVFHSPVWAYTQLYLYTFGGVRTKVRVFKELHEAMVMMAVRKNIGVVMSSSMLPNRDSFYKILESEGWRRRGDSAVFVVGVDGGTGSTVTPLGVRQRSFGGHPGGPAGPIGCPALD
jgi:hypothetical protein